MRMPRASQPQAPRPSGALPDESPSRPQVRQVAQLPERLQGRSRERAPQHQALPQPPERQAPRQLQASRPQPPVQREPP